MWGGGIGQRERERGGRERKRKYDQQEPMENNDQRAGCTFACCLCGVSLCVCVCVIKIFPCFGCNGRLGNVEKTMQFVTLTVTFNIYEIRISSEMICRHFNCSTHNLEHPGARQRERDPSVHFECAV